MLALVIACNSKTLVDKFLYCRAYGATLQMLKETPVRFRFIGPGIDSIDYRTLVQCDALGRVKGVCYRPRVDYLPLLPETRLQAYQRARQKLVDLFKDPSMMIEFRLHAGDCMVFDNTRMLHGRSAFRPEDGVRQLQGCYIDINGPRNLYRILRRNNYHGWRVACRTRDFAWKVQSSFFSNILSSHQNSHPSYPVNHHLKNESVLAN